MRQPAFLGELRRARRARDDRVQRHNPRVARLGAARVRIHQLGQELLVEAAPVDADAHRLAVRDRHLDDGAEVLVAPLGADVAGVDAILGERRRALGILGEQQMAVVVEVADDRDVDLLDDARDGRGRGLVVDRHPHELAAGLVQGADLRHRGGRRRRCRYWSSTGRRSDGHRPPSRRPHPPPRYVYGSMRSQPQYRDGGGDEERATGNLQTCNGERALHRTPPPAVRRAGPSPRPGDPAP